MSSARDKQRAYLNALGIERWVRREPHPASGLLPVLPDSEVSAAGKQLSEEQITPHAGWEQLRAHAMGCTRCGLAKGRTHVVFGVGDVHADWLIVGEGPGAEEDRQGEPFVGRAGKLLNAMLLAIGLQREAVYITNIVKCRPPQNRDPKPEEAEACSPYLRRQIDLLKPKIILSIGRISAQNLLKTDTPVGGLRGRCWTYAETDIPVVVTYHPAYLLRSPKEKRKAWADLQFAWRTYQDALVGRGKPA